jgi:hydrophobe/amphiphile efflux-1 (HAE1) family protein
MRLNVSAWSIRRPVPSVLLFVVLTLLGIVSFQTLPITRFPNIDVPVVAVTVTQSGAAPAELETQVTKRIEDAVANVTGVKNLQSTVTDGVSTTGIEFQLEVDVDRAVNDVKDAISKIRGELPRTIDEPIVQRIEVEGQSILTYAVSAPGMTLEQLSWYADDVVKRTLQGLRGVGKVDRIGGVDREILVSLDPDRLMAFGVTAAEVNRQVRATNTDLAGGRGEVGGQEQSIRTLAGARTVEDLARAKIALPGGREVRLDELGTVTDSWSEPRSFARLDGEMPVVALSIFRAKGASELDVKNAVERKIAQLGEARPDVTFSVIDDSVSYTVGNYESAMMTLFEGAALAVIVVLVFLRDWRATLIAAVALPLSIIPTFWAMSVMGFSLNLVSLLAITLVTGILVDDAIVEIENIVRHIKMGKSPWRAALEAADEIGLAVIAISLTIVAVFAPVSFMGGIPGQYFKQFGLTVAVAVLFSLLVARLITPMMAAYLMRPHKGEPEARDPWAIRQYTRLLAWTLRHRFLTMAMGLGIFAASLWSTTLLPTGFLPAEDASRTVVNLELPPGATLAETQRRTDEAVRVIREIPEVTSVFVIGGSSATGQIELRKAALYVKLTPKNTRERTQKEIEAVISEKLAALPDLRAWYVNERGEREFNLTIVGTDPAALDEGVAAIAAAMRKDPNLANVAANAGLPRPEVIVAPRLDEAARFGVTPEAISEAVRVATIGDVDANLADFNAGDRLIPIRVQLDRRARSDLELLQVVSVTDAQGRPVPLNAVADIRFGVGPSSIERYNRVRRVQLGADLQGGMTLGQALERVQALPEVQNLPPSVRLELTGDVEIMADVFAGFAKAMGAGIMLVLVVLILLFGSVFHPLTILLSLPLAIGGVILALLVTHNPISMPVVIGILMLMGIVTKNAIMLVDFAVEREAQGMGRDEAMLDAGRKRARPIVMTTIAMVAGMLPSAYGVGEGGEFRAPMAIGVIGGLLVSTVLSLVFVPALYSVMDDLSHLTTRLFHRLVRPNPRDEPLPAAEVEAHRRPVGTRPQPVELAAE